MSSDVVICLFASFGYDRAAQGVAGAGRDLAAELGGSMHAVIVGSPEEATTSAVAAVADSITFLDRNGMPIERICHKTTYFPYRYNVDIHNCITIFCICRQTAFCSYR